MSTERRQLETAIAALEGQRSLLGDAVADAALRAMRERLAALAGDATRQAQQVLKHASILFLDIVGSTRLSERLDPEETSAVMDGALSRATAIVDRHGGRVLQYAGDNLLAAFGADESREDDAERAVRCGLALLELGMTLRAEVRALHGAVDFDLRLGLHSGRVLLGGGVDHEDTIRGVAVNIAARMEQTAPAGTLRISHDTYAQVRGLFDVLPQEPLAIKGVDAPVLSYLVQRAKPRAFRVATRGLEGVATRMIGRDAELSALKEAFARLFMQQAGLQRVTVVAEAGVGKSRLLYEFRNWAESRAERFFLLQARATPSSRVQSYGMLRDLLAWRLQIGEGDSLAVARKKLEDGLMPLFRDEDGEHEAEAQVHLLGQLLGYGYDDSPHIQGIRDDARQIRSRAFRALAQALRRIAAQGGSPIVMYLDDLHWADDASLDFIDHLVQADHDVPLLIVGLARPTLFERRVVSASDPDATRRIDLQPLNRDGSRELADEMLQKLKDIPAGLRELIIGGAAGNPFYMEELVKMLIDRGAIRTADEQWTVDAGKLQALQVPPTLTGVLQARLDSLPSRERHALQLASVIGLTFWDAALARIDPPAAEQIPGLVRRELVHANEDDEPSSDDIREYAFRHQLLQQVTYDTVLRRERQEAHATTAQWLVERSAGRAKGLMGTAAEHFERAGDAVNAADCHARAADYAASAFANEAALDHAARALQLAAVDDRPLRWRLLATRERIFDLLGRRGEQRQDIEALLALADALDDDARRAEVAWRHCDYAMRTDDWATMRDEAERAKRLAERVGDEELALRAVQRLSNALAYTGDPAAGRALATAALGRAVTLGWLVPQSRLANALATCTELQGDRVATLRYAALGLSLNRRAGDRLVEALNLGNVGSAHAGLGNYVEARRHLEEALRLNRVLGNRPVEGMSLATLSDLSWREGDGASACVQAEAAVAILTEVGSKLHVTGALWSLGNAELQLDRHERSSAAFERCEAVAREVGQSFIVIDAIEGQARVALARDDREAATSSAHACSRRPAWIPSVRQANRPKRARTRSRASTSTSRN